MRVSRGSIRWPTADITGADAAVCRPLSSLAKGLVYIYHFFEMRLFQLKRFLIRSTLSGAFSAVFIHFFPTRVIKASFQRQKVAQERVYPEFFLLLSITPSSKGRHGSSLNATNSVRR